MSSEPGFLAMSYASHGKTVEERREEEKAALRNITRTLQETEDTSVTFGLLLFFASRHSGSMAAI